MSRGDPTTVLSTPATLAVPRAKPRRVPRSLAQEIRKEPELRSLLVGLLAARLTRPARESCRTTIECYPGVPYHRHVLWKVAHYAGMRLLPYRGPEPGTGSAAPPGLRLFWPDLAGMAPLPRHMAPPPAWWSVALNGHARDASKRRVEQAFEAAFGYALAVDPLVHAGPCVAKSDRLNSAHDGRILECPLAEADPALAYEVLIDNRADPDTVVDFRAPVLGGEIPFVYRKYRPLRTRFSNTNAAVEIAEPGEIFSAAELDGIRAFCRAMRLDLGEIDVLRDAASGRIYVVDVNRTAWGPPRPMPTADAVRAVRSYAAAMARLVQRMAVNGGQIACLVESGPHASRLGR